MMVNSVNRILSLSWFVAISVLAQAPDDPYKVCRRYGHQTAVVDRRLYIDGGWVNAQNIQDSPIATINQNLLFSDLGQVNVDMPKQGGSSLQKPTNIPSVAGGVLWPDDLNKFLWQYGGESEVPGRFSLWGYDIVKDQWTLASLLSSSMDNPQRRSYGGGASLWGYGYYFGGYSNNKTSSTWTGEPVAQNSLLRFNMDNQELIQIAGPDSLGRAEGSLQAIPASKSGMLVYFGGASFSGGTTSTATPVSMSDILLYDLSDGRWFQQTATGQVPAPRRGFCAGVAWSKDQSSYNIYLYGGFGFGENSTGFDDVYILTMPSFQWIKWYPEGEAAGTSPHGLMTCNVIEQAQMIIMGGNWTDDATHCDVIDVGGQHNLNLGQVNSSSAKWFDYQPSLNGYSVPQAIIEAVGGSATGSATKSSPSAGFQASELSVYFTEIAPEPSRTARAPASPTTTATKPGSGSKPNVGAIAGGAVGGAVVLILFGFAVWWCCFRKRKHNDIPQEPTRASELASEPRFETKSGNVDVVGSPESLNSHPTSPYGTPPPLPQTSVPGVFIPPQPYQYPMPNPGQQPYFTVPMQQQGYGYAYPFYPMHAPQGSDQYPIQAYSLRPDVQRRSPDVYEMPVARSPGMHHVYSPSGSNIVSSHGSHSDQDRPMYSPQSSSQHEKSIR